VASAAAAGAAALIGGTPTLADEEPPETTTVRLAKNSTICFAPMYVMDELLRAEGFTDIRHVPAAGGFAFAQTIARGEIDFGASFAGSVVYHLEAGLPITTVGCVHAGCYELFAHEPIRTISDLKRRRIGIQTLASSGHLYLAVIAAHVGLDPQKDIEWVESGSGSGMELFAQGKTDAFLGFPPEPQELRARKVGRVILSTATDRPWSQYLCCMLVTNREFVRAHPVATKRVLRALLKAADFCAANPAGDT
jgi:NitT/TauT family transport system substrate-binding protein